MGDNDGIYVVARDDGEYPAALRPIRDAPRELFVRGTLLPQDEIAVAIVGARRASEYGKAVARRLAADLAACGVTIVSGMARGIDGAAHQGALDAGGRTLAVLGCGPDVVYPTVHAQLMRRIICSGAVISEFRPETPPRPEQFPQRNRIISGLAKGVVVVEGRVGSGSLITADFALEQGREVFAVPGNIFEETSWAPHHLVSQGARLVASADDILDELKISHRSAPQRAAVSLDDGERAVWAQLSLVPQHVDRIAILSGQPVALTSRILLSLEAKGLVGALAGQRYVKKV
ncbi:MAG TPA: DNA-processing protein DprA [bacterium]|nr:DNA-processing protein DprA [bacterium]